MNYTENELRDIYRKDALKIYQRYKKDFLELDLSDYKGLYLNVPITFPPNIWYAKYDIPNKKLISISYTYWQSKTVYKKRFLRKPKEIIMAYSTPVEYEISELEFLLENDYLKHEQTINRRGASRNIL